MLQTPGLAGTLQPPQPAEAEAEAEAASHDAAEELTLSAPLTPRSPFPPRTALPPRTPLSPHTPSGTAGQHDQCAHSCGGEWPSTPLQSTPLGGSPGAGAGTPLWGAGQGHEQSFDYHEGEGGGGLWPFTLHLGAAGAAARHEARLSEAIATAEVEAEVLRRGEREYPNPGLHLPRLGGRQISVSLTAEAEAAEAEAAEAEAAEAEAEAGRAVEATML